MYGQSARTIAVLARPSKLAGFDKTLPAGAYDTETDPAAPRDRKDPQAWKASVMIHFHPPHVSRFQMKPQTQFQRTIDPKEVRPAAADDSLRDPASRALGDVTKPWLCRCKTSFRSEGFGQRIRARGKGTTTRRAAAPDGVSNARRRFGARPT